MKKNPFLNATYYMGIQSEKPINCKTISILEKKIMGTLKIQSLPEAGV